MKKSIKEFIANIISDYGREGTGKAISDGMQATVIIFVIAVLIFLFMQKARL